MTVGEFIENLYQFDLNAVVYVDASPTNEDAAVLSQIYKMYNGKLDNQDILILEPLPVEEDTDPRIRYN